MSSPRNTAHQARGAADPAYDAANAERWRNSRPSDWVNPRRAQRYNLAVIGGGPAGLVAARCAVAHGARVALIENTSLGGVCLNAGCIPSKSLIRTGHLYQDMLHAAHFGAGAPDGVEANFGAAMSRMRIIQARVSREDAADRLRHEGIDVYFGAARFLDDDALQVEDRTLCFHRALVATGSRQSEPEIPGLVEAGYLDVAGLFALRERPRRLMVVGGGPLGTEIAQVYRRLGSQVFLVHDQIKFLPREERDAAQLLSESLARDGVEIHLNTRAVHACRTGTQTQVALMTRSERFSITVDNVLTGLGRVPNIEELGLDRAGVECDPERGIVVDDFLRTSNPRVYAAGDVCLEHKFTHVAEASARIAVSNALFPRRKRFSRIVIPWCTYTDPEIAHVGAYVDQANRNGVALKSYTVLMNEVDRAVTDGEEVGFVKIHVRLGSDEIVGATVVARHAGEMINEITTAMQNRIGLAELSDAVHVYPTQSIAIKKAADACKSDGSTTLMDAITRHWLHWCRR